MAGPLVLSDDAAHQDPGGRAGFDDPDGKIARDIGCDEPAARLHHEQFRLETSLRQSVLQAGKVALDNRFHIGVGDGGAGALVFPVAWRHLG